VRSCRHCGLEPAQLVLEAGEVGGAREDVVAQRAAARRGRTLVVERDARPLLPGQLAGLERDLSGQGTEQRRLAGAVGPRQSKPVAAFDLERDGVEERRARELLAEVGSDEDGHGVL
jgi:hypothetical protein